jgi:hypothetical protein
VSALAVLLTARLLATAQPASLEWHRISAGGGSSSSGSTTLVGTIGQPDAGTVSAGNTTLHGGFWSFAAVVPAPIEVITWTNLAGGDWTDRANWSPNRVPGPKEIAAINLPGTYTVTLDYNAQCRTLLLGGAAGVQSLDWAYGGFAGTMVVETNAVVNLSGGSLSLTGTLENRGRIVWPAGKAITWRLEPSSTLWNRPTGVLDLQGSGWFYCVATLGPAIHNEGLIRKTIGPGEIGTYQSVSFVNTGTIEVQTGMLSVHQLDSSGLITVSEGAVVRLLTGKVNFQSGHTFAGTGTWWWSEAAEVSGRLTGGVRFTVSAAGRFAAELDGTMHWTNGTLSGNLTVGKTGRLNISTMTMSGLVTNSGQVTWNNPSGNWYWNDGARFENLTEGTLEFAFDRTLALPAGACINNRGTLLKSGGTGLTSFRGQNVYTNSGLIDIRSGTLEFLHGLTSSGSIHVAQNCSLLFRGYDVVLGPNHKFTGLGSCSLGASTLHVQGPLDGTVAFRMDSHAVLDATLNASMLWSSGSLSGGFAIGQNGVLTMTTPGTLGGTLTNFGTVLWQNPTGVSWSWAENARFVNASEGLFDLQGDFTFYGGTPVKAFHNAGTFRKSKGTGTAFFQAGYAFTNSGKLEVQAGKVWLRGPYSETASAGLSVSVGGVTPITQYSQIQFDKPPVFAGRFAPSLLGGYHPGVGTSFTVLSYPSAIGTFSTIDNVDLGTGLTLTPQFSSTALVLSVVQSVSRPALAITRAPGSVRITLPEGYPDWRLFSASNLVNPIWELVPTTNGTTIDLPALKKQEVFRLQRQ